MSADAAISAAGSIEAPLFSLATARVAGGSTQESFGQQRQESASHEGGRPLEISLS
jgi:hypothetical protein